MNILIVDDDTLIRNWLSMMLNQLPQKINLFEANDGVEALEICDKQSIDLVITDIVMPRMDGIELIKELKTRHPSIRTSVLSSYDDFEYVRIALRLGALDYIPKIEMKIEDISDLISKVNKDFELEKSIKDEESADYSNIIKARDMFLEYLSDKDGNPADLYNITDPPLEPGKLGVTIFVVSSTEDTSIIPEEISRICQESISSLSEGSIVFPWESDTYILLYNGSNSILENQREENIKLVSYMAQNLEKYFGLKLYQSINLVIKEEDDPYLQFVKAVDLMDLCKYYDGEINLYDKGKSTESRRKEMMLALQHLMDTKKNKEAVELLNKHLEYAHENRLLPHRVRRLMASGLSLVLTNAAIMESQPAKIDQLSAFLYSMSSVQTEKEMNRVIGEFSNFYLEVTEASASTIVEPVRQALAYIHTNYGEKIGLEDVAAHVFLNPSYLSQLFKKEMGITFGDYLENVRINNAKLLIRTTDKSIAEISELVGFSSQNYFARIFRKATGVSPVQYKRI